jgi:hypothetical protein
MVHDEPGRARLDSRLLVSPRGDESLYYGGQPLDPARLHPGRVGRPDLPRSGFRPAGSRRAHSVVSDDTPDGESLSEVASAVGRATAFDRVIDASLDALAILVPVIGPGIAAVSRQVIPKDRDIYDREFALAVVRRIDHFEAGRVDPAYFHTDEWVSDVEQVLEVVGSRRQRGKRRYFIAALANCATHDGSDEVERNRFLDELDRLRLSHLRLLSVLLMPPEPLGDGSADGYLLARMPDADIENVKLDWSDLQSAGMVDSYPTGMTVTPKPQLIAGALRAFGKRFGNFIEADRLSDVAEARRGGHR